MTFSRSHTGMVGIIGLFTWMIAPIAWTMDRAYPFPLTDIQTIAYITLFTLAIGFYLVSIRQWWWFRIIGTILVILIWYISYIAFFEGLHSIQWDRELVAMWWGWIFIWIGVIAVIYTVCVSWSTKDDQSSLFSDTIIGIIWTVTLIGLSSLIISASIPSTSKKNTETIISKIFGDTLITSASWYSMSPSYRTIHDMIFERKNDTIEFIEKTDTGGILHPAQVFYPWENIEFTRAWENIIIQSTSWTWIDNTLLPHDEKVMISWNNTIILQKKQTIEIHNDWDTISYTGESMRSKDIVLSENNKHIIWAEKNGSGYVLKKDGEIISDIYEDIWNLHISRNGYETIALAKDINWTISLLKNWVPNELIRNNFIDASFTSNGSHSIYAINQDNTIQVIYDWVSIGKSFTEVREIFLEKSGGAYAFFARPNGTSEYCLFTRYKWNLCGLSGYMNPRISADGSTIIFSWRKNGVWGIYRNTTELIKDTGYSNTHISWDYFFCDITNPKQYLYIEQSLFDDTYKIRKNGKLLPEVWEDVWLDVAFWYDNTIIMSAKKQDGWHIIEI